MTPRARAPATLVLKRLDAAEEATRVAWTVARDEESEVAWDAAGDAWNAALDAMHGVRGADARLSALLRCPNSTVRTAVLLALSEVSP